MDALDLLEEQHRDVLAILERIATEPSAGERARLVAPLVRMIDAHVAAEEQHLYPACAARTSGGVHEARFRDAVEARALVRFAAENLLGTRVTDVRFEARLKLLRRVFEGHASEEEGYVFQRAKSELRDEELDVIGDKIARACALEREAPSTVRKVPRTPSARRGSAQARAGSAPRRARVLARRAVT